MLVPGDVIEIPNNEFTLPCDFVLLSGQCIVNESMLTGESIPVVKNEIPKLVSASPASTPITPIIESNENSNTVYIAEKYKNHTLYAGTKVIQTRVSGKNPKVLALVSKTAFNTSKGRLILSILFPKPTNFKFYRDSWNFIGVLTIFGLFFLILKYFF